MTITPCLPTHSGRSAIDEPSPPKKDSRNDSNGYNQSEEKTGAESAGESQGNKVHR